MILKNELVVLPEKYKVSAKILREQILIKVFH